MRILHVLVPRPATMKQRQWANAAKRHQISTQPVCSMRTAHALRHHYPCPPPPPHSLQVQLELSGGVGFWGGSGNAVSSEPVALYLTPATLVWTYAPAPPFVIASKSTE